MKNFLKQFEEVMASVAFAEAGEHDTARQMLRQQATSNKTVLLATDTEVVHNGVVRHALNLCKRMGGKLEILHILPLKSRNEIDRFHRQQMPENLRDYATTYTHMIARNPFEKEVINYTESLGGLLCVVLDTARCRETENNNICQKYLAGLVERITCPVVIYTGFLEA